MAKILPRPKPSRFRTTFGGLTRSELMSRIRSSGNLTTELRMVRLLRSARITGWRRGSLLPGKPDFVWSKQRIALFIDGCFWHGHNCGRNLTPKRNARFWRHRIEQNQARDRRVSAQLRRDGWKVLRFWECSLVKRPKHCINRIDLA